tara:strand:- start:351 stop:665 length:315 start_codon:yes stop_codon:yes gene_type:complete
MGICHYVAKVPPHIRRTNKPRMLGMIISVFEERPHEQLSSAQVADVLKHRGLKHYPHTRSVAAMLAKYTSLFKEIENVRVRNGHQSYTVKQYKLREDYNVDRKV